MGKGRVGMEGQRRVDPAWETGSATKRCGGQGCADYCILYSQFCRVRRSVRTVRGRSVRRSAWTVRMSAPRVT